MSELADGLGDALTLFGQRRRGRLDRQQTLAATLDWSYGLLDLEDSWSSEGWQCLPADTTSKPP